MKPSSHFTLIFLLLLWVFPLPNDARSQPAPHQELTSSEITADAPEIYINEILTSNRSSIEDEDGATTPWIELYNAGSQPVNLHFFGLSNDSNRPWRWIFPDITLEPDDFQLVFLSGKNRSDPHHPLHTGFRVNPHGADTITLVDLNGRTVDRILPAPMETDISYGRLPDGSDNFTWFDHPTPGWSNATDDFPERLNPPVFSHNGGYFYSALDLELTSDTPGSEIRYTLDGSVPDSTSRRYLAPIRIDNRTSQPNTISAIPTTPPLDNRFLGYDWYEPDGNVFKGMVVRARTFRTGSRPSPVITHTYFVDEQGPNRYPLATVSISTDSLHLFDYETGIYIPGKIYDEQDGNDHLVGNYAERGREWERPASFELFDEQGDRVLAQNIGIRIHGGASRSVPQKSLRLYARNDYGEDRFHHPIFPDQSDRQYKRLVLRNSGQDFFVRSTMFRDAFMQELVKDFNFQTQAYRPAVVFVNGEYWGIHNIRERYDVYYLSRVYGVDPYNIDLLDKDAEVKEGDNEHYQAMLALLRENDPADNHHFEQIKTMMDVDNFLDYIIAQVFIRNMDWPGNNIEYWRLRTGWNEHAPPGHDGRWRWLFFDTDAGFGLMNLWQVSSFDMIRHMTNDTYDLWPNPLWSTFLIRRLLENETFRTEFIIRSADYLNTVFRPDHVTSLIDRFEASLEPAIEEHIRRWGQIESKDRWHFNVNRMREFAEKRPGYVFKHISEHFDLKTSDITLDVSALHRGRIQVNRMVIDEQTPGIHGRENVYPWKGTYFQDLPVKIIARPYHGYTFSHWEGKGIDAATGLASDTLIITPTSNLSVKAVFIPDGELDKLVPAAHPLGDGYYRLIRWDADSDPGSWPDNMAFQFMENEDPQLHASVTGFTSGAYDLTSGTRINGLGEDGFAFVNTSDAQADSGYPDRRLGAAVLALDTREMKNITVNWTGGTVSSGSKMYHLRLQYRINGEGLYQDVLDDFGDPVVYRRHHEPGHSRHFEEVTLPSVLNNKPYVELRWTYYYTGDQLDTENDTRDQLRVADIHVRGDHSRSHDGKPITGYEILPNYPNPFNSSSVINFYLPEETLVTITVYDTNGRLVRRLHQNSRFAAGHHPVRMNASGLASGIYIYRVETPDWTGHGKMSLIR